MREILFRGQTRRYGEKVRMNGEKVPSQWVYGGVLQGGGDFSIIYGYDNPEMEGEIEKHTVYTDTLGQYTGLTDKNGKRIYEGDIVKATHTIHFPEDEQHLPRRAYGANYTECGEYVYFRNYVVKWSGKSARMEIRNGSDSAWLGFNYIYNHAVEIIGNIHDNPEMIGGAEDGK